jgi:hypothetical protein
VGIGLGLIRVTAIAFLYALIEVYYTPTGQGDILSFYHVIVFLIGFFAGLTKDLRVTVANALVFSVLEDAFYWVLERRLPVSWSPGYIVVCHVPVYYIPFLFIAVYLYKKSG